jgi:protein-tyrosine phosphatase
MIDIHTHVLAGLDDGARTLDDSVAMVRLAAETGTTDLVATPHENFEYHLDPQRVEAGIAELQQAAGSALTIHRGCDFHLYPDNIEDALANPTKYTINHKRYLLVEFPDLMIAKDSGSVFARLLEAGMVPIVTHPERNFLLHGRLESLASWVAAGCLTQVTAQSLEGRFGPQVRRVARELLRRGLVHFIASDAHDATDRTPRLDRAYRCVARRYGREWADLLFTANPGAVLRGDPLPKQPPPPAPRWWHFWS